MDDELAEGREAWKLLRHTADSASITSRWVQANSEVGDDVAERGVVDCGCPARIEAEANAQIEGVGRRVVAVQAELRGVLGEQMERAVGPRDGNKLEGVILDRICSCR